MHILVNIIIIIIHLLRTRGPYHRHNQTTQEHKKWSTIAQIDLEDNDLQRVHPLRQERRNNENSLPIIARFVPYKKRNEFLTNKRDLKNIEGREHVFVCEDLTP